jgi:OPT family oligopeptide transporter
MKTLDGWKFWKNASDTRDPETTDPHVKLMLAYKDTPNWWYGIVFCLSILLGLISIYKAESTLPWWGFLVALSLSSICILFFGAQYAITGFAFNIQPVIQMIGGYMHPGKPVANMYFVLFGYNSVSQGMGLLKDLKMGQYTHLSPRCTFTVQMVGTIIGSIFSYIMMESITTNQREILLSIEGTNVWSGQQVQTYNSQAVAWGGLASKLFSIGGRYQWVTLAFLVGFVAPVPLWLAHKKWPKLRLNYWNTSIISYYIGFLCVGINSSLTVYFAVGFFCQFYLRKYRPNWFIKYNYILSAAMDGGTQVLIFILTFSVFGGSGKAIAFPKYWGNNFNQGNNDYCMKDMGSAGQ